MGLRLATPITSLILLTSCATFRDSSSDSVAITSDPPGATILHRGDPVGKTPTYLEVSRRAPEGYAVQSAAGPIDISLKRHYRWRASFWPNLIFLWGAPVGWLVDILSGAAFAVDPASPPSLSLSREDRASPRPKSRLYAIAPPRSDEPSLTDAAGDAIEAHLKQRGQRALGYRQTLPVFTRHGYDFDRAPDASERAGLYANLKADVVVESKMRTKDDRLVLETKERPVFGERAVRGDQFEIQAPEGVDRAFVNAHWWSRLLPNTLAIDLAPTKTTLTSDGLRYPMEPPPTGVFAQSLDYLSSVKISSLPGRRLEGDLRWTLTLVPTIRASRRRFVIPGLAPAPDGDARATYTRLLVGAGYGPELGLQTGKHYIYLNVIPLLLYSDVAAKGVRAGAMGVQVSAEIGYLYFLNSRWNARLFSRSQNENDDVWKSALKTRLPAGETGFGVSNVLAGASIGYRFEPRARFSRTR